MSRKPSLLVVTTTFPRWKDDPGPAPFVFHHARALAEFFEVTVLAPHFAGAHRVEEMDGVAVRRFMYGPPSAEVLTDGAGIRANMAKSPFYRAMALPLMSALWSAAALELRKGYGFVNSHWLVPSGLALTYAPGIGRTKHVITVHAADYDLLLKLPLGAAMMRRMVEKAGKIVCVSNRLEQGLSRLAGDGSKIARQPMGVDTRSFRFKEDGRALWREKLGAGDDPLVLFVGKLSPKKGVEVLIDALADLPDCKLAIAGEGALKERLLARASARGVDGRVNFIGGAPNRELPGLYSAADAVAAPSVVAPSGEREGMPVVVLEALAAGRPVVATEVCEVPTELVGKGVTVVPSGSASELAAGIRAALDSGRVDPAAAAPYDVAVVARRYAELFGVAT